MGDYRVRTTVVEDDGSDGLFWRNGDRWMRQDGREFRYLDVAPNLEASFIMEMDIYPKASASDIEARELSRK